MKRRNIGGSILPSSCPRILAPIECAFGRLQVRAMPDADTHALFLTTERGETLLASHPNGYSCHSLAERMAAGNADRVREQAQYILDCGGTTASIVRILDAMHAEGRP